MVETQTKSSALTLSQAIKQLGTKKSNLQNKAQAYLLKHPKKSANALLKALEKRQEGLGHIALMLAVLKHRPALNELVAVVAENSSSEVECAQVVCAISELVEGQDAFDENIFNKLEALLDSPSVLVRGFLVKVFLQIGGVRSAGILQKLAQDPDEHVASKARLFVLKSARLSQPDTSSLASQIEALNDPNAFVQKSAILALKKAGNPSAAMPLFIYLNSGGQVHSKELCAEALAALANCLTGAEQGFLETLLKLAKDTDLKIKAGALLCLGRISDAQGKSLKPIILSLVSPDEEINKAAAIALSEGFRQEHEFLVKYLVEIYESSQISIWTKEAMLIVFGRVWISDQALKNSLRPLVEKDLYAKARNISKTAIVVLEGLYDDEHAVPTKVVQLLKTLLIDQNKEVRIVAASFLAKHGLR